MSYKTGCLVCGKELEYFDSTRRLPCFYCGSVSETSAACTESHYVCDSCHSAPANDLIEKYCVNSTSRDPVEQAIVLMKNPAIKMHGPEHHFLVPAVLLAAYYNSKGASAGVKAESIAKARKRAEDVKGGFCGLHGACGAAIGTGIFISVLTGSTPLSKSEWKLSNLMTAEALRLIAENEGPRCCKRDTFLAVLKAVDFLEREFGVEIPAREPVCTFDALNRECHRNGCRFYRP